ncbi:hypothetical protein L873DRAFT_1844870 [Choiromyces venosus 120613-1]|uniref:HTH CENPB-type domain-containing protein n=1 Tax=Choiromyces venosus 120613-1 TaxID=1336337 RepID=A0A3N4JLR5_9PEZI|nr:hypothetical protein L873DRAFT_1844870 [Choiromyces venosus 120613-1]
MPVSSSEIEDRIQLACKKLLKSDRPNIAATACEFDVSESRLQARWKGCPAKSEPTPTNRKLTDDEELVVCLYLKHLDEIGTSARLSIISSCTNVILQASHLSNESISLPPTVSSAWTSHFVGWHPKFHIKKQKTLDHDRKNAHNPDDILD